MIHFIKPLIKETTLNYVLILCSVFFLASFISCHGKRIVKNPPKTIEYVENNSFTLDFIGHTYDMKDVDRYFLTTFPHDDPTKGDVVYDRQKWINNNMITLKNDGLYLYIKQRDGDTKFDSVRMTSKSFYNVNKNSEGLLFIFKGKLPSNKGVWPAWWLNGSRQDQWLYKDTGRIAHNNDLDSYSGKGHFYDTPSPVNCTDWPAAGEIDIIETINGDNLIHNTIHTCPQMCDSTWNKDSALMNCANAKPGADPNSGCSGKAFQSIDAAGTFVCLWKEHSIEYYYWEPVENVRGNGGPLSLKPNPMQWKDHLKNKVFLLDSKKECRAELHQDWQCKTCEGMNSCKFENMKMIFNITLCGIWAGVQFDDSDQAVKHCQEYVLNEGRSEIHDQFLKIEYISVKKL